MSTVNFTNLHKFELIRLLIYIYIYLTNNEYNEMFNMRNDIRYDIHKYCIKQEDD